MSTGIARAKNSPRLVYERLFSVFFFVFLEEGCKLVGWLPCKVIRNSLLLLSYSITSREKIKSAKRLSFGILISSDKNNVIVGFLKPYNHIIVMQRICLVASYATM